MFRREITWLAHNTWRLTMGKTSLVVDPFLLLPSSPCKGSEVRADYVLVSHGHSDHCASALEIVRKNDAVLIGMAEVASWFGKQGVKRAEAMNIGGSIPISFQDDSGEKMVARVMMVPALHSSTMPDGTSGGNSCGFLLSLPTAEGETWTDKGAEIGPLSRTLGGCFNLYFACDTGYFSEMEWLGSLGIDVAILPIGDRYTLGPEASLDAILALKPKRVIPSHFDSWPPIHQDVGKWADAVRKWTDAEPLVVKPGESATL